MERKSESKKFSNVGTDDVKVEIDDPSSQPGFIELLELPKKSSNSVEHNKFSSDFTENENILRLSTDSSLSQAITLLYEKLTLSSFIAAEVTLNHKIDEISYEDFMQIFHLLHEGEAKFLHIKSNDEKSKDFLLWCGHDHRRIFVLPLQNEEKGISSHVRRFLLASLRSGHDGLLSSFKYEETNTKVVANIFSLGDARGFNLLLILSESGDVEGLKNLLKLGFDVHNAADGVTAIDLAYDNKHFDVMLELLKNHSLYPENFNVEGVSDELKNFLELSDLMHKSVIDNNGEKVLEILDANPTLKFYYNTDNNSVVTCALVRKNFKIYEHLMRRNFVFGRYEDIDGILGFLNGDEKAQKILKRIHEKHSKPLLAPHLMILISNSSMGHDNENDPEKISAVTLAFQTLDKDPRLSQLLKVVASTRNFKITFDFERDSVRLLDPSVEGYVNGLFTTSGKILIAAKDLLVKGRENIAYGVIAHELCHFALYRTFDNDALPYAKSDEKGEKLYKTVLEYCETKKHLEEIVASAYDDYPEEMIPPEVAVRYPHILGHYHDQLDEIADKSITFGPLKTFHEEKVMPAIEEAIGRFEKNADIRGKYLNARKEISLMRNIIRGLLIVLLVSLIGAGIVVQLVKGPTRKWNEFNAEEQKIIKDNVVNYFGVEVRFGDLFDDYSAAYGALSEHQLDSAVKKDPSGLNEALNQTLHSKVVLKWENCTEGLKHKIMNSTVDFQGSNVKLGDILDFDSPPLYELKEEAFKNLIEGKEFKISSLMSSSDFFIPRRFKITSTANFKEKDAKDSSIFDGNRKDFSVDDVIDEILKKNVFLLIDGPGSGKSTVFKNLPKSFKKIHPDYWVVFVTLKDHVKVYEEARKYNERNFSKLIGEKILKLDGFNFLLFNELYTKGKVAIFWDAFDEVNSKEHGFLLNLFQDIKSETKILQFLSSRPEHQSTISSTLIAKVFGLIPFGSKDREIFFDEKLRNLTEGDRARVQKKIRIFLKRSDESFQPINNPLMLKIIADVLKDDENLNIENRFEIYQKFVDKQIDEIQDINKFKLLAKQTLSPMDIHTIYAIKLILSDKYGSLDIMQKEIPLKAAEVAAFGLMTVKSDGTLEFVHKTFAEFFVAIFIVEKVFNMIDIITEQEMDIRSIMLYDLVEQYFEFDVITDFLFEHLRSFHQIKKWKEGNLKNVRKSIAKNLNGWSQNWNGCQSLKKCEIFRRFLIKDEETFEMIVVQTVGNFDNWLKDSFNIKVEDVETKSQNNILDAYAKSQELGNIMFRIWNHYQKGEFSLSYLINKHTGIQFSLETLVKIGSHENFWDFYKIIPQDLKYDEVEMFKENFEKIFLSDHENDNGYLKIWHKFTESLKSSDIGELLSFKNNKDENIFHIITRMTNPNVAEVLLEEIGKFWARSLPIKWRLPNICQSYINIRKVYWNFIKKYLNDGEQKKLEHCDFRPISIVVKPDNMKENIRNRFDIYKKFVDIRLDSNKTLYDIHEFFALKKNVFPFEFIFLLEIMKIEILISPMEIASFGLMELTNDLQFNFVDEDMGDFFVAHYIVDKIFTAADVASESEYEYRYQTFINVAYGYDDIVEFIYDFLRSFSTTSRGFNFEDVFLRNSEYLERFESRCRFTKITKRCELVNRFLLLIGKLEQFQNGGEKFVYFTSEFYFESRREFEYLNNSNDLNLYLKYFKENHQLGIMFFYTWNLINEGKFSEVYLISKYSGLNLDEDTLIEISNQKDPYELYQYISKNITDRDASKMMRLNFEQIFNGLWDNGENYLKMWFLLEKTSTEEEIVGSLYHIKVSCSQIKNNIEAISDQEVVEKILKEVDKYWQKVENENTCFAGIYYHTIELEPPPLLIPTKLSPTYFGVNFDGGSSFLQGNDNEWKEKEYDHEEEEHTYHDSNVNSKNNEEKSEPEDFDE